jgi:hypothetical protein
VGPGRWPGQRGKELVFCEAISASGGRDCISFRVDLRPVKMHPALAIAECALPRRADALQRRSSSVTPNSAVPCVIPGPAQRKRSLVFFLIRLWCAEDDLDK